MASKKPPQKGSKKTTIQRPVSGGESPVAPGYPLPAPAPSYRGMSRAQQQGLERSVGEAGKRAYGRPIRMQDAVNTRVSQIESAIARAPGGVPDPAWYDTHQGKILDIAKEHGLPPGSAIDTSATLSSRNRPSNELLALRSAAHIATNPMQTVTITPEMSQHVGDIVKVPQSGGKKGNVSKVVNNVPAGSYPLDRLNPAQVATLADAQKKAGESVVPQELTDVTHRSAGRDVAARAIKVARGSKFDEVAGESPKVRNYARAIHLASPQFSAYDREVLSRRATHNPAQGLLFRASDYLGDKKVPQETVEDYIGGAMSAHVAAETGKTGVPAREAQNIVNLKKTSDVDSKKTLLPPNLGTTEAFHAFNEEATHRAAESVGYKGWGPGDEDFSEHITPKGAQVLGWVEYQRHVLNEDPEYNARMKAESKANKAEEKRKAKEAKAYSDSQPTLPGM